jgi:hypothetical protein
MNTKSYRALLIQIRDLLLGVEDTRWGPRLQSWTSEFDALLDSDHKSITEHIKRTRRSIAGMGSIGDIVICGEAGHKIAGDDAEVARLNAQLQSLTHSLFVATSGLLKNAP